MVTLSHPEEAPRADPHAGCCGSRGRETPGDPVGRPERTTRLSATGPHVLIFLHAYELTPVVGKQPLRRWGQSTP